MISQIDAKLEKLITLEKITDREMKIYLGKLPKDSLELLEILKSIRRHIRTYGRKSDSLEAYIEDVKNRLED